MNKRLMRTLGRKVRLGRFGLPVWTMALAIMAIAAVAGQAVGPVLSGEVTGKAGVVVSQTVVLKAAPADATGADLTFASYQGNIVAPAADDSVGTRNDEGTEFTFALETQVGQLSIFTLVLDNTSGATANFILELNAPAALDIDADGKDDASVAQLSKNTWLGTMTVTTDTTPDIQIAIESKDDAAPGFYTITGKIIQVAQ